jgi:dTDP-4-amino-4,6-dideoxygalactose transaminase
LRHALANQAAPALSPPVQHELQCLEDVGLIQRLRIRPQAEINGHLAAFRMANPASRNPVLAELGRRGMKASFHYIPLHSAPYAREQLKIDVELPITDLVSRSLVRLPLFPDMSDEEQSYIIEQVRDVVRRKGQ